MKKYFLLILILLSGSMALPAQIPEKKDLYVTGGLSLWNPLGTLNEVFDPGITLSLGISIPLNTLHHYFLDIRVDGTFPAGSKSFYFNEDGGFWTKSHFIANLGLFFRNERAVNADWTLGQYAGIGYNALYTDEYYEWYDIFYYDYYEDYFEELRTSYYSLSMFSLTAGVNLRYKKFGLFIEFDYTPYHLNNKVDNYFGNKSLKTGINIRF